MSEISKSQVEKIIFDEIFDNMKEILLLFILISFKSFGQNPDLVRTWYLTEIVIGGNSYPIPTNLNPPARLIITNLNSQTFQTNLCNDNFIQGVAFDSILLTYSEVISTLIICNSSSDNFLDIWYSNFFRDNIPTGLNYFITQNSDLFALRLVSPLGNEALYQSQPLSKESFEMNLFSLVPNPAEDVISIKAANNLADVQITIYNTLGQIISSKNYNSIPENVDVSDLIAGIYHLEIVSQAGKETKKFIKK